MKNVAAGWFIPWISPASLLGLDLHYFFQRPPWPATALLALVAAAIVAIGLLATRIANRDVFLVAVSFLVTIGASALYLAITGREGSLLGGYKSFKLVSFFEPALWCSFLLVLREPHPVLSRRRLQQLLAIALVAGNAIAGVRLTKAVAAVHASVSREFSDLQKLEADPRVPSINILSPEFWDNMWETTFLFHKKLYHLLSAIALAGRVAARRSVRPDTRRRAMQHAGSYRSQSTIHGAARRHRRPDRGMGSGLAGTRADASLDGGSRRVDSHSFPRAPADTNRDGSHAAQPGEYGCSSGEWDATRCLLRPR